MVLKLLLDWPSLR